MAIDIEKYNKNFIALAPPALKKKWKEVREEMFVHTRGTLPKKLIHDQRPNEDPEVYKHRLKIYQPITKGSMNRAIDMLYRIFQSANYSIKVSENTNAYLSEKTFKTMHKGDLYFYSYIQSVVVRRMLEDPNALLIWLPVGEGVTDAREKVDVRPVVVPSALIHTWNEGVITFLDEFSSSEVVVNGQRSESGAVYWSIDDEFFYRHIQVGNKAENKYRVEEYYRHGFGKIPFIILGGNLTSEEYFESYYSPFLPFGNEAIRQYSDWQGVMTTSAFPYREELQSECSARGCQGGQIKSPEDEGEFVDCGVCNGTGFVMTRSPYGAFIRAKGNNALDAGGDPGPVVRFVSPAVDILQFSTDAWKTLVRMAEESLHLRTIDEAQSGTAKRIDREEQESLLVKISNNLFDEIIYKSILFIEMYRERSAAIEPVIVKPISFAIRNETDLIKELGDMKDKNLPLAFMAEATNDLARKRFAGNVTVGRIVEILSSYDTLFNTANKDKSTLYAQGLIKKEIVIKSLFAYKVLQELVSERGTEYLETELNTIFTDLDNKLAPIIAEQSEVNGLVIPES